MKDLHLGDAHIVPVDDVISRAEGEDVIALVVAQCRERGGRLSGIKLSALSSGLQRVARLAHRKKASVHLPRIGHSTPNFNWYGTERLVRKHLASAGIPTYIHYFPRARPKTSTLSRTPPTSSSSSHPPTTPSLHSLLPPHCQPLPEIFSGVVAYLYGYSGEEERRRERERYLVAYNGDVTSAIDDSTTHIICRAGAEGLPDSLSQWRPLVVSEQWIDACLQSGKLIPTNKYLI